MDSCRRFDKTVRGAWVASNRQYRSVAYCSSRERHEIVKTYHPHRGSFTICCSGHGLFFQRWSKLTRSRYCTRQLPKQVKHRPDARNYRSYISRQLHAPIWGNHAFDLSKVPYYRSTPLSSHYTNRSDFRRIQHFQFRFFKAIKARPGYCTVLYFFVH